MKKLKGKTIAILATNGFEHSELFQPKKQLERAGAVTKVVSIDAEKIKSWKDGNWGESIDVDCQLANTSPAEFDALLIPGGVINPDLLRDSPEAVEFVKGFFKKGFHKPVAAICHGPWMLIEAGVIKNRKATSYSSIKTDMVNAGAKWVDEEVVVDKGIVTSRSPADLKAFCAKIIEEFDESHHAETSQKVRQAKAPQKGRQAKASQKERQTRR